MEGYGRDPAPDGCREPIVPPSRASVVTAPISSLVDLARVAGVSVATVSRSLAGNPGIAVATRERIVELARVHGFKINQAARNLRLKRTGAIGVVLPLGHEAYQHLSDPFFMSLLGPLADAIAERDHDMLVTRVVPRDDRWLDAIVDSGRVDGVIVIGQSDQADVIERVARRFRPLVVWGAALADHVQITVGSNNAIGGRLAAAHLLKQGRRALAFFGNPDVPEVAARYAGFRDALATGDGTGVLLPVHLTQEASYAEIGRFLDDQPLPDGIVAASDVIAMSTLRALAERGHRVPHDIGVVGYDDVLIAQFTTPALTTVRQDVVRGAATMVDLLFRQIDGDAVASVSMDPEIVLRASA